MTHTYKPSHLQHEIDVAVAHLNKLRDAPVARMTPDSEDYEDLDALASLAERMSDIMDGPFSAVADAAYLKGYRTIVSDNIDDIVYDLRNKVARPDSDCYKEHRLTWRDVR